MNIDILPDGHTFAGLHRNHYQAMLVDVPWKYLTWSKKGRGRSADRHYPTMTIDEIKALPVRDLVAKNCVMFFWVIDSHVLLAHDIISAWGFKYKTVGLYWAKTNKDGSFFMGSGFWTRANPEHAFECYLGEESEVERCFLNTIGKPKRTNKDVRRLIVSRRRDHSQKPDETHERIERLVAGPYLELFARRWRDGWSCWGNELNEPGRDPEMEALI